MNFKSPLLGVAAAAIAVSAATIAPSSAQAFSIAPGSALDIGGVVQAQPGNISPLQLLFSSFGGNALKTTIAPTGTGSFAGAGGEAPIQNLSLTALGGGFFHTGSVANFITNIGAGISFDLTDFIYNNADGSASFKGFFKSGADSIAANGGLFTSQLSVKNPTTYSASIAAIPTPALLPAVIGLGMGVLRKRKKAAAEAVGAEA